MAIDPTSYFANGDIIGWMSAVFESGTYNLGYAIVMLFLVAIAYIRTENASVAVGLLGVIATALIPYTNNTPEVDGILLLFSVLSASAVVYMIFAKKQ